MKQVEFWFDFASSYSYPAALRIEEVARAQSVPIIWRPFLLGPIFKAQGWHDSPFNIYPAKGNYMWRDLERLCESLRIPFRKPSIFPRNGVLAASIACLFSEEPWIPQFVRHMFLANFAEDRDISDISVLASVLERVGQPASLHACARLAEGKAKLRSATERSLAIGIFGAPSFVVGSELFWGNERLDTALAWARRSA
jgi:2-hydroxychromene-2-carboxylate isomerase